MTEQQRIKKIIKWLIYSDFAENDREIADKLGYTKSSLSQIVTGKVPISEKFVKKLCSADENINEAWISKGEGKMLKSDTLALSISSNIQIPLVNEHAVAGFGNNDFCIAEQDVKEYYVIPKFKYCHIDFMIEVHGSSMYPKYNSGDIIACTILKNSQFIQWNKCHIIATKEQGILVKRLLPGETEQYLLAVSDNKEYPPFQIPCEEITGIALVAGVIRLE